MKIFYYLYLAIFKTVAFIFKILFKILYFIFIGPLSVFFKRDSRCHGSPADRLNAKIKYHSKEFDDFSDKQEVLKIASENIPASITAPVKNTSKLIYCMGTSFKSDYNDLLKKGKIQNGESA